MCRKLVFLISFVFVLGLATTVAEAADPDLIAWWTCDEGAGNVVGDASGNGHDGTFVNGDPAWVEGIRGSAVQLTGPTLIEIPPLNVVLTEATMAGWIKPNGSQPDWSSIIMTRGLATGFNVLGYQLAYHWNDTSDSWGYRGGDMITEDDWTFVAVTIEPDKATFYVNGVAGSVNQITHGSSNWDSNVYLGGDGGDDWIARRMDGALDDVSLYSRALTAEEIMIIMEGIGDYPIAGGPDPADGALHADTWITLSWKAGDFAVSHDVYMGENFDEVNNGTGDTFRGNQEDAYYVAGFPGFAYPDGLVNGTTYYWRIDEVNEAEPNSPWKGDVWSFSIPPKSAYSPNPAEGAEFVDLNVKLTWTAGFGAKLHYVIFGEDFDEVSNATMGVPNGTTEYTPGSLKLAKTYYWRIDEFDGVETHKGDVWSFTTLGAVSGPNPSDGAVDIKPSVVLRWDAGAVAASHEVYFGTDADAVKNATTASPEYKGPKALGEESYDPGKLIFDTTYFWRIDEVNDSPDSPWAGNVWSFSTGDFFVIDDFEDYDAGDNQIWFAWHDGLGAGAQGVPGYVPGNGTGAAVGDETTASYTEETIVHGGSQSMPLSYDNNKQGFSKYSEAEHTLTGQRDWTEAGVANLSLWFRGNPASVGSFVEGPVGTYTMTGSGADIWDVGPGAGEFHDEFHYAYKTLAGPGSIVAKVESVDDTNAWAKAGVMIRETLKGDSKHAMMIVSASSGVSFQRRPETAGASASNDDTGGLEAPYWVKIERDLAGNFSAYSSATGSSWQKLGVAEPIQMGSNVYIGLVVTSHDAALTCQAVLSNVSTTGSVGAQWVNQDIGIESNDTEPLYVVVSNSAGAPAVVVHDDPAAAQIDEWTQWIIPLQAIADQGITLTDVDKIAIGLGTQGNMTVPGGSGKMYIDDIRLLKPAPEPEPQP